MSLDGLTGVQKAAVLLITLGPERSAEIFQRHGERSERWAISRFQLSKELIF